MESLIEEAWRGEELLLLPQTRGSRARLLKLLAPDFYEIGQSGTRWDLDDIVAALTSESDASGMETTLSDREAHLLGSQTVLLSYRLVFDGRESLRSALWCRIDDSMMCVFHQGTSVRSNESVARGLATV